ncbi:hypothetical protein DFH09DRAFT_1128356 [Mycena vulgaris]|nr:hypothetical protein DFH09DRAFT_1128356 [Mycena vulgaris]
MDHIVLRLYSDVDQLSPVGDVKAHIAAAKKGGLNVREELFLGSPHGQHFRADADRYWGVVRPIWGEAVRSTL